MPTTAVAQSHDSAINKSISARTSPQELLIRSLPGVPGDACRHRCEGHAADTMLPTDVFPVMLATSM
jgi:hypothetical protein